MVSHDESAFKSKVRSVLNPDETYTIGDTFYYRFSLPYEIRGEKAVVAKVLHPNPGPQETISYVNERIQKFRAFRLDSMGLYSPHLADMLKRG
jgi:hypothetical protein